MYCMFLENIQKVYEVSYYVTFHLSVIRTAFEVGLHRGVRISEDALYISSAVHETCCIVKNIAASY